jgi:hypothetical protein
VRQAGSNYKNHSPPLCFPLKGRFTDALFMPILKKEIFEGTTTIPTLKFHDQPLSLPNDFFTD